MFLKWNGSWNFSNANMAKMCKHSLSLSFAINSVVCGYHGYKDIWTNAHGDAGVRLIMCIIYNMLCSLHGREA